MTVDGLKWRSLIHFLFSCSDFDGHFKLKTGQNEEQFDTKRVYGVKIF